LGFYVAGCGPENLYVDNFPVQKGIWPQDQFFRFEIPVQDTIGTYDIYLQVRNDGRYGYSNLWLFIRTNSPTGATIRDTIECRLANDEGRWLGRGSGGRYSMEIPYRYRVRFPYPGTYSIEIQHGMRASELVYITDVGIRVQKAF